MPRTTVVVLRTLPRVPATPTPTGSNSISHLEDLPKVLACGACTQQNPIDAHVCFPCGAPNNQDLVLVAVEVAIIITMPPNSQDHPILTRIEAPLGLVAALVILVVV